MKSFIRTDEITARQLSMEELAGIAGGEKAIEEEDNDLVTMIINALVKYITLLTVPHRNFEEFYQWGKKNKWKLVAVLAANTYGLGSVYLAFPESKRRAILEVVYYYIFVKQPQAA